MTSPLGPGFLPPLRSPAQPLVKPMFRVLAVAASGLSAQRVRMETIAGNIANAQTTRTEEGGAYRRRVVQLAPGNASPFATQFPTLLPLAEPDVLFAPAPPAETLIAPMPGNPNSPDGAYGVRVTGVAEDDATEGAFVYEPGHPDADANGYVRYPNVRITDEIVDLMDARRVFEANATVFQSAKQMLRRALEI